MDGFYLDPEDNICKKCTGSCKKCTSPDSCDLCEGDGLWAQSDGKGGCECLNNWVKDDKDEYKCRCNQQFVTMDYNCVNCQQLIPSCGSCTDGLDESTSIKVREHPDLPA